MKAIEQFQDYLTTCKNFSVWTSREYAKDLHTFASYAKRIEPGITWGLISKDFIQEYEKQLMQQGYEPATVCRKISAIASFYDFAKAIGKRSQKDNPARFVTRPKRPIKLPRTLTSTTIQAAMNDYTVDIETRAFLQLAYTTGMRLSEILELKSNDIDWENATIRVWGKGAKQRIVYTNKDVLTLLQTLRYQKGGLFSMDARTTRYNVYQALVKHSSDEDMQLSPHAIRHTFATLMIERGMNLKALSMILGHATVKTTERYLHASTAWTQKEYEKALN